MHEIHSLSFCITLFLLKNSMIIQTQNLFDTFIKLFQFVIDFSFKIAPFLIIACLLIFVAGSLFRNFLFLWRR